MPAPSLPVPLAWVRRVPVTATLALAYVASLASAVLGEAGLGDAGFTLSLVVVFGVGLGGLVPLVAEHARPRPNRRQVALGTCAGTLLWLGSAWAVRAGAPWWLAHPVNTACLLLVSILVGSWLAAELEQPGHLVPLCVLAGGVDVWSALAGPTEQIARETSTHVARTATALAHGHAPPPPPWSTFLVYVWPQPGAGGMAALVGFGDLVFLALLLAATRRFELGMLRVGAVLVAALGAAVSLALALHRPVPALPLLCGAFLVVAWPRLRLSRREWWITAATAGALGLGIALSIIR